LEANLLIFFEKSHTVIILYNEPKASSEGLVKIVGGTDAKEVEVILLKS